MQPETDQCDLDINTQSYMHINVSSHKTITTTGTITAAAAVQNLKHIRNRPPQSIHLHILQK